MSRKEPEKNPKKTEMYQLGKFRFSIIKNELLDATDNVVPLRAQTLEVLTSLIEKNGEVVSKQFLYERVWGDAVVTEDSLIQCISEIRKVLGDKDHTFVQTFPKKGYKILATPVETQPLHSENDAAQKPRTGKSYRRIGAALLAALILGVAWFLKNPTSDTDSTPRIAVLPFNDLSVGEDKGYLSDAIAEGVITELARNRIFEVIAKNSSFRYRDGKTDSRQIGSELNVHYILEGSQQINDGFLRVSARLIDANGGVSIWAHTYEMEIGDLFIVQDQIVKTVADRVGHRIKKPVPLSSVSKVTALHLFLQATETIVSGFNEQNNAKIIELNELAVKTDPTAPYGYLGLAFAYRHAATFGWNDLSKNVASAKGFANAYQALDLAPENPDVHYALARLHADAGEADEALNRFSKAIELNPSSSNYLAASSTALLYTGRTDEAIERLNRAMGIDPFHPDWYHQQMAWALWEKQDCTGALRSLKRMNKIEKGAYRMLTVTYACLGEVERAKQSYAVFYADANEPTIAEQRLEWQDIWSAEGSLDRWLEHMKIAGMKE